MLTLSLYRSFDRSKFYRTYVTYKLSIYLPAQNNTLLTNSNLIKLAIYNKKRARKNAPSHVNKITLTIINLAELNNG
jgi:2-succinyl-5-enolpyruvyl-6-hydroxy-3-cyclohexene-1-carboxylate synthase